VNSEEPYSLELGLDCKKRLHVIPEGFQLELEGNVLMVRAGAQISWKSPLELLNLIWEISIDEDGNPCEVVEAKVNPIKRAGFRGRSVLRRVLGRGPLLAITVAKGRTLEPRNHAKLFSEMVKMGLDIGIDPLHAPSHEAYERAYHIEEEIDNFKEEGKRVLYVYNIPSNQELIDKMVSMGVKAFRIDAPLSLKGFDDVSESKVLLFLTRPYLLPTVGMKAYSLLTPFGFDVIERPSSKRGKDMSHFDQLIKGEGSLPMTSPDITPRNLDYNMSDLDVIIWADVFAYAHPAGVLPGVKASKEMIDSYLRGENLLAVARRVEEVGQAVEKWGLELR